MWWDRPSPLVVCHVRKTTMAFRRGLGTHDRDPAPEERFAIGSTTSRGMDGMTGVAVIVGFPLVVTSHARLHADRFFLGEHVLAFDFAVAG